MKQANQIITGQFLDEKLKSLTKVRVDEDWNVFYVDSDGIKWCKSYPNSGYHGGGEPTLREIDYLLQKFQHPNTDTCRSSLRQPHLCLQRQPPLFRLRSFPSQWEYQSPAAKKRVQLPGMI